MAATFVFLLLSALSSVAARQRPSNISLGSTLSASSLNSSWLSSSGRFSFGFYPQGNSFAVGIWFAQIPIHTIIWTANRKDIPLSINAQVLLTGDGRFILPPSSADEDKPIAELISQPISWASMLDTGNLVLYNSKGEPLWQSFDYPSNTLLPGQRLLPGQELLSSKSATDDSNGRFRLKMQHDGNLVQYPTATTEAEPYAYWASETNTFSREVNVTLMLDDVGQLYLVNSNGKTVESLYNGEAPGNMTVFHRITIDVDGIFRVYSIGSLDQKNKWSIVWESSKDKCKPMGICGSNAYCTVMDQRAVCKCIPGFNFIDENDPSSDCLRKLNPEDCGTETQNNKFMSTLENIKWPYDERNHPLSILPAQTEGECAEACLAESSCNATSFQNQECIKLEFPLRYGKRLINSTESTVSTTTLPLTFVKVSGCSPTLTTPITLFPPGPVCYYVKIYM